LKLYGVRGISLNRNRICFQEGKEIIKKTTRGSQEYNAVAVEKHAEISGAKSNLLVGTIRWLTSTVI
jgi:hypothetical protein